MPSSPSQGWWPKLPSNRGGLVTWLPQSDCGSRSTQSPGHWSHKTRPPPWPPKEAQTHRSASNIPDGQKLVCQVKESKHFFNYPHPTFVLKGLELTSRPAGHMFHTVRVYQASVGFQTHSYLKLEGRQCVEQAFCHVAPKEPCTANEWVWLQPNVNKNLFTKIGLKFGSSSEDKAELSYDPPNSSPRYVTYGITLHPKS
jgi:hypothetical protein